MTAETISFASDEPPAECLPLTELADCAGAVLGREGKTLLSYGAGGGYTPLRELIAEWFGVHPYRVVLTNGSLQGLALVAGLMARGRSVMTEWPSYDLGLQVLLNAGASLLAAVVEDDGLSVDDVELQLMGKQPPAFLYTMPNFQNPTGRTLTAERRRRLVESLGGRGIGILEDDHLGLLRFEGEREAALFDYAEKRSVYCSSFSATIAPGLRVGWLVAPETLAGELTSAAATGYIAPSLLGQATVNEFIRRGSFEPQLRRTNELLAGRRDAMLAALARHLSGARWTRPEGGYFIWVELPFGTDTRAVLERAEGVTAVPGVHFGASGNALRLSYSDVPAELIETGIERLAAAL